MMILLKNENYKEDALKSFKDALQCLSNEMSLLNATQILLKQKQDGFVNSDLYKQLIVKATILGSCLNAIHNCIDAIKRSMRLIDVVATEKCKDGNGVLEKSKHFMELERDEQGKSSFKSKDLKLSDKESYTLTFKTI